MKHFIAVLFTFLPALGLSGLVSFSYAQQGAGGWERDYGEAGNDQGYSVQQTSDGGYIIAGWTYSFGSISQVYLVKTDAFGDTLWTRTYGGTADDQGYSVQQTSDGGYVVAGWTNSLTGNGYQVYLVKTDAFGDTLWTRTYGGTATDEGYSVQQTQDGGYIVAGSTWSFGNGRQVYLVKTNAGGDTLWTRTYGEAGTDYGNSVQQTSDGGYIVAGGTTSFGNSYQVYLIRTNAGGDTLWTRTYGGADWEVGHLVQQTSDGGYIVAGATYNFIIPNGVYLVKTNAGGDTLWTKTYRGGGYEYGNSVQQTQDGGYIVAGATTSFGNGWQVYLIKTNASGDSLLTRTYGGAGDDQGYSVQQTSDGGYIVAGATTSFGNGYQVYLIKTDSLGSSGVEEETERSTFNVQRSTFKITPNPFTSFARVPGHEAESFDLYDISGRKVGTYQGDRIGEGLSPGVYFLRRLDKEPAPLRIVKVR